VNVSRILLATLYCNPTYRDRAWCAEFVQGVLFGYNNSVPLLLQWLTVCKVILNVVQPREYCTENKLVALFFNEIFESAQVKNYNILKGANFFLINKARLRDFEQLFIGNNVNSFFMYCRSYTSSYIICQFFGAGAWAGSKSSPIISPAKA
jgi:hypothetical protein